MNTIHLKVDVRVPKEMYDFLLAEANVKKLSFEGVILQYIRERMEQESRGRR